MILIHPPLSKPCEPPAGIARLAGATGSDKRPSTVIDANLDAALWAVHRPVEAEDTWTRRSVKNLGANLAYLRNRGHHLDIARYSRAVADVNRILEKSLFPSGVRVSLSNYHDRNLTPLKTTDLIRAAEEPEKNPFYGYFRERLISQLSRSSNDHIGISLNFLSQALTAFSMIGLFKKEYPNVKIILGGGLVTSWIKRPGWKNPFSGLVDEMVAGPGEEYIRGLLGIDGKDGHCRPVYDQFRLKDYLSPGLILPYSASSGCYWQKCLFCPEKAEGNPYKPISVDLVLEDLESLINRHNPALVHFLDNAMSPSLLKGLIDRPLTAPWYGFARMTDHFKDPDFCTGLRNSGCALLKIGIESGNQNVLDQLQKGIDLETASIALKNIKKAGIGTFLYFLFGTPPEGHSEAMQTLDFVKRHHGEIDFMNLSVFNMPVNGPDAKKYDTSQFYEGDLSFYSNFRHPKSWNRDKVRAFLEYDFKKDPVIRAIVKRTPPFFTSNHAAFYANLSPPFR
ncbi:MAG: radical SAM protein [Deltaproteobacteria bacterium]|nr:radical SAM protein [Deltaproteobacteria bacterium]